MGIYNFRGGVHPKGYKELSADKPLKEFLPSGELVFPVSQHVGKPAIPVVKRNDLVKVGQLIARADGFISSNIHSSVSGKVKARQLSRGLITPASWWNRLSSSMTMSTLWRKV